MYLARPHAELNKTVTVVRGGWGCEGVRVPLLLLRDLSEAREQTHQSLNINRHHNQQYKILPDFIDNNFKLLLVIHSFVPGYPHQQRQEGF